MLKYSACHTILKSSRHIFSSFLICATSISFYICLSLQITAFLILSSFEAFFTYLFPMKASSCILTHTEDLAALYCKRSCEKE